MRGADPAIVLVPGVGMFSFGRDKQTARVAGEFYVNAINVMRGRRGRLDVRADPGVGEVPHRVLGAGGGEARADAQARSRWRPGSRSSPARRPASAGPSPSGSRPRAPAWSSPTSTRARRPRSPPSIGPADVAVGVAADVSDEGAVARGLAGRRARVRRGRPGRQQRRPVDLQAAAGDHRRGLGPAARRHGARARSWSPGRPPG